MYNCHLEHRPVYIWTLDVTLGVWTNHGLVEPVSTKDGSCDTTGVTPFTVPLQQGHWFFYVAVDPDQLGCSGNNPTDTLCQRSIYQNTWFADPNGPVLVNQVN